MATQSSFPALLASLTQALSSASESAEKLTAPIPPENGISLFDVKNELFLSYLQNLVFLIVLKLRNRKPSDDSDDEEDDDLDDKVVKKLVELQVYLERGVRPLESRLQYQIDKALRAADDAKRDEDFANPKIKSKATPVEEDASDEEVESDAESTGGAPLQADNGLHFRPNYLNVAAPINTTSFDHDEDNQRDGIYKPPRIQATAMPTTTGPREKADRQPKSSATLNEFISTELSAAPFAEASIGANTISGGRRQKGEKQLQAEAERKEYEERNYVRLPKESKKERKKNRGQQKDAGYGGEEWRGLGEGVERIERLTKKSAGSGVLEKSRKRGAEEMPRREVGGDGAKRVKALDGQRRDRGRKGDGSVKR